MTAGNAGRAHERATIFSREAAKWHAEALAAVDHVRWTKAAHEAALAAAKAAEQEELRQDEVNESEEYEALGTTDPEAIAAFEAAAQAMQEAVTAQEGAGEALARRDELNAMPVDETDIVDDREPGAYR